MAPVEPVSPVKQIVGILWADRTVLENGLDRLRDCWGPMDYVGDDILFGITDYYENEMGTKLARRWISFTNLIAPESTAQAKLICNKLEFEVSGQTQRKVNLDIGYLDHNKVVLASMKYAGQKIHLTGGIYADLVGRYKQGRYQAMEWSFPDFKDGRYDQQLLSIRKLYLQQRGNQNS